MPGGLKISFKAGHVNNPGRCKDRCSVKAQQRLSSHHAYISNEATTQNFVLLVVPWY